LGQFLTQAELTNKLSSLRRGKKVVFTNGCFDLLHVGHIRYLQEARAQGDILVVGLNADASVKRLKGAERPLQVEDDRGEILASLACVDFVSVFTEDTPAQIIEKVKPDVLVKGGDWSIDKIVGADFVIKNGGQVKSLQFVNGKSTTNLVEKIKKL
jgi:D-glycero-beta-D-manno-heptose 1-phosphate adenylyltransferase